VSNYKFNIAVLLTGLSLCAYSANAQVERFPGLIDRQTPDVNVPESYSLDNEEQEPLEQSPILKKITDADKVLATLKSVSFEGNTVIDNNDLQEVIKPYIGKKFTKGDLSELKFDVKKAFYDKGYILVRVVTKPQKFSNGNLKVNIYEAKVGDVVISAGNAVKTWLVEKIAGRVKSGQVITEKALESMVSDLRDLPGVDASVNLRPGKKFSTTDLNLALQSIKEDINSISVDNYGSELTGEVVAAAHLEKSNLFKLGEKFTLDLQRSEEDLWSVAVGAATPIGIKNIKLETFYIYSENEIGARLEGLRASGETNAYRVALSSKLLNTRKHQTVVRFGYEDRTHESFLSDVTDTKDNLRKLFVESSYIFRGISSVVYAAVKISKGMDIFGASEQGDINASRLTGDPEAWILEPTILINTRPFSDDGNIKAIFRGQISSDDLLSSDLFTVGGYGNIRGFDVAQEAAEAGYNFNIEYNHIIPTPLDDVQFKAGPFFDGGAVYNRVQGSLQDTHFYSAGIGIEARAKIVPAGDTVVRFDWAHPIGSYRSNQVSSDTIYLRVKQEF
jgi:hemolysin activation/secretion protein